MQRKQELAALLVLAVVASGIFGYFLMSSPTSNVELTHSKSEATETAKGFIQNRGYDVSAYRTSTVFSGRDQSAAFIQRRLSGSKEQKALEENAIYGWEVRFYRPLQQESFTVVVDHRTGNVSRFVHEVPDEESGGNLTRSAARQRAKEFLRGQGHTLASYNPISSSTTERADRVDHTFVWQHTSRRVAGAPYRVEVTIHGERIGNYDPHLKVPDGFVHQHQVQQNRSAILSFAFLGLSLLLAIGAIVYGLRYYKAGEFDTRLALKIGGAVTLLTVVGAVNSLPSIRHSVPATIAPWQFLLLSVGGAAIGGVILGGIATIMTGSGNRLHADVFETRPLDRLKTLRSTPQHRQEVRMQLITGILVAAIILGVYGMFYLVGTRLANFWLPAEPPQVDAVAVYVPALAALVAGGTAALWEEVTYRLFAIPLAKRYLRYTVLAVVLPAVVWGLGHSGYAVLPFWARAVEVTLIGIILGVAFLRYGIVTTIAAHFSINAFLTAVPLLQAGTSWLFIQGLIALLIALLPAIAAGGLSIYDRSSAEVSELGR